VCTDTALGDKARLSRYQKSLSAWAVRRDAGHDHRDVVFAAPGDRRGQGVADGLQVLAFPREPVLPAARSPGRIGDSVGSISAASATHS
jgi:hypothetical protein